MEAKFTKPHLRVIAGRPIAEDQAMFLKAWPGCSPRRSACAAIVLFSLELVS